MSTAPAPGIRDRLVEAASQVTCDIGWSGVTMANLAGMVGVSRQTVYNELGSKPALGQAMVLRELDRFLTVVAAELDSHDDLVDAIGSAAERILDMARDNPLLRAVLSTGHGATNDLLPLLTTHSEPLIDAATAVIASRVPHRDPDVDLSDAELATALETIVRLVLSHVMQPGGAPAETANNIAWVASRLLGR